MIKNHWKHAIVFLLMCYTNFCFAEKFAERTEVQEFVQEIVAKHNLDQKKVSDLFKHFGSSQLVLRAIAKPYEAQPWHQYRKSFLSQNRIRNGVSFWQQHAEALAKAEKQFGVPPSIIVAILGVETFYGKNTGQIPVLQSLATLAFDYPKRSKFFRKELEQFILLTQEQQLNPVEIKGSYAGAMGLPQFISSSYRHYAVDFAGVGQIDIINNIENAIGSVANYFKVHGWKAGESVIHAAKVTGNSYQNIQLADKKHPKPSMSMNLLASHGIEANEKLDLKPQSKVSFIELETAQGHEHWLGRDNFYVITRYNQSTNYAMAVYQLSEAIKQAYQST